MVKSKKELKDILKKIAGPGNRIPSHSPEEIKKIILTKYDNTYLMKQLLNKRKAT